MTDESKKVVLSPDEIKALEGFGFRVELGEWIHRTGRRWCVVFETQEVWDQIADGQARALIRRLVGKG